MQRRKETEGFFYAAAIVCRNNVKNVSFRSIVMLTNPSQFFIAV